MIDVQDGHHGVLRRFGRDTQGNVALLFGLMAVPLVLASGVGIDYARAASIRTSLQSTVDSAALAGASVYLDPGSAAAGQAVASSYVTKGTAPILSQITLGTPVVTAGTQSPAGDVTAYTMKVSVSATVPTTLMALVTGPMTVNATATARNPVLTGTVGLSNWKSGACDTNSAYWYPVPEDGGIPPPETLTLMFTNSGATNPLSVKIPFSANQKIGFAFKNVTGGKCGYGSNQYGGAPGSTHWFYSSQSPPNGGAYASTATKDCSLQVIKGTFSKWQNKMIYPAPKSQCFTTTSSPTMASVLANAAPSCAELAGATYKYVWNDMGGSTDDRDYDDGQFTYACTASSLSISGTAVTGVTLID
jgi:Flp pilus assembly protein TadG